MAFKSMVRDWKNGIGGGGTGGCGRGKKAKEKKQFRGSHIAPEGFLSLPPPMAAAAAAKVGNGQESRWANMPPELLLDIIQRVESSEIRWPARRDVVACASVCKSWRHIAKEVVKPLQLCGSLTFPISLKQPGPREYPVQCFIKRERATSTYRLYLGLSPALTGDVSKLLLAARKIRRATSTEFIISLSRDGFSRSSSMYVGKLRSNFLGIKFTICDSQAPGGPATESSCQQSRKSLSKLPYAKASSKCFNMATISYELNVLRTRGPRRMNCTMHSIPFSSIQEGGTAPTPTEFSNCQSDKYLQQSSSAGKTPLVEFSSTSLSGMLDKISNPKEPLILKNKAPRWHEQLQCWCLNFKGRVTVASVKNFQLVAAVEPHQNVSLTEQEKVILQFGKIGKDIFTMDYRYPLSALQAFAICLSSFDTKPACE